MTRWTCRAFLLVVVLAACSSESPPPPAPPPVTTPDRGGAAILTVNFDVNSYRIRPESQPALNNAADAMRSPEFANSRFDIDGHTDVSGRLARNQVLSDLRARAVVDYLASRGVDRSKMTPHGYGPLRLLDQGNPRSPTNRRVEIVRVPG
jgi:outer membrane protein OmpA-like peptidoglycan-associated protein